MGQELLLKKLLEEIDGGDQDPDKKVQTYFQPPENLAMEYPCIVYELDDTVTQFADNKPYRYTDVYQVTLIHEDPLNELREKIVQLRGCSFNRFFITDNLNHYVYTIYF